MAIANEINILKGNIRNAYTSIQNKGGTIPTNKNTENLSSAIDSISAGGTTTLGTKTITTNGVYNASDDNLDGYSQVTVDVKTSNAWQRPTDWYDLPTILSNTEDIVRDGVTYYPRIALQLEITNTNPITIPASSLTYYSYSANRIVITSDGEELNTTTSVDVTWDTSKNRTTGYVIIYMSIPLTSQIYISSLPKNLPVREIVLGKGGWSTPHIGASSSSVNNWLQNFETLETTSWSSFGYAYCFTNIDSLQHLYLPTITTMSNTSNSSVSKISLLDVDIPNLKTQNMGYFGNAYCLKRLNLPNLETATSESFSNNYALDEINIQKLKTFASTYFLQNSSSLKTIDLSSIVSGTLSATTRQYNLKFIKLPTNFKITGWNLAPLYGLTKECLLDILNKLADVTGESTAYTITFGSHNLAKLTTDELAIGTGKGWTIK